MAVNQLSVFLDNTAGRLAEVTRILGEQGVNIRGFSVADTADFGILRLLVNDEADRGRSVACRQIHRAYRAGDAGARARCARRIGACVGGNFAPWHERRVRLRHRAFNHRFWRRRYCRAEKRSSTEKNIPLVTPQELKEM